MRINDEFVSDVENFLDLIENEGESSELSEAIETLRLDLDSNRCVGVEMIQDHLVEIWDLISADEKRSNGFLENQFHRLTDDYEELCEEESWDDF